MLTGFVSPAGLVSSVKNLRGLAVSLGERAFSKTSQVSGCSDLRVFGDPSKLKGKDVLVLNRNTAAMAVFDAAHSLGMKTTAVYSGVDATSAHRFSADRSFPLDNTQGPVQAYLNYPKVIETAKKAGVHSIHPVFGFVSEDANFYRACLQASIIPIGCASPEALSRLGDKIEARKLAKSLGVPIVPGTQTALTDISEALSFCKEVGFPVILKAAGGGGGKGMRVVRSEEELSTAFQSASSEALKAFGNPAIFIEKFIETPRHVELQAFGSGGTCVIVGARSCDAQRRYQKLIEIAPALITPQLLEELSVYAKTLVEKAGYNNLVTIEFIVDQKTGKAYFMEANTRIQVEHTVTERAYQVNLRALQLMEAFGCPIDMDGLRTLSHAPAPRVSLQCRILAEDKHLMPASGVIGGVTIPTAPGFEQIGQIVPGTFVGHYDSMMDQFLYTGHSLETVCQMAESHLSRCQIGIPNNLPFLRSLLRNPDRLKTISTNDIDKRKDDFLREARSDQQKVDDVQGLLRYLATGAIQGYTHVGASATPSSRVTLDVPDVLKGTKQQSTTLKKIIDSGDRSALQRWLVKHRGVMDTTWRDAHQSLFMTRIRTKDILDLAPFYQGLSAHVSVLETWGGATFDVALQFLKEDPFDRLIKMKEVVPHIPFQMLLRGANAVGYTAYPDNAVFKFCELAKKAGMDIFRVFDSLNDPDNLALGMEAAGASGGVVEAAISFAKPLEHNTAYNLDYYLNLARTLVEKGTHILCIKDMAGLLTPDSATLLVSALRKEFPHMPIHVHTHDTGGTGAAAMVAASKAGASLVDVAMDPWGGGTSQPKYGAVAPLINPGLEMAPVYRYNAALFALLRSYGRVGALDYKPTGSDVFDHQIPGGQYTNMQGQAAALGLSSLWPQIQIAYAEADKFLGGPNGDGIPKVTPSSKVVGDLAQFMVSKKVSLVDLLANPAGYDYPSSVIDYFQGGLGTPPFGFPTYRDAILERAGKVAYVERAGASLPPVDFNSVKATLEKQFPGVDITEFTVMNYVMYPKETAALLNFQKEFGRLIPNLDTYFFWEKMQPGDQFEIADSTGKIRFITLNSISTPNKEGVSVVSISIDTHEVRIPVTRKENAGSVASKSPKVDSSNPGHVGASINGKVTKISVKVGDVIKEGAPLFILEAMKMETVTRASKAGTVKKIHSDSGATVQAGDLIVEIG